MGRLIDGLLCALAVTLAVLGAREVEALVGPAGPAVGPGIQAAIGRDRQPPIDGRDRLTVLLLGADRRTGDRGRSDTLLVLLANPQTSRIALLGLPRDLYASVPGHGKTKLNHAYAFGGPELSRQAVEGFIGMAIDRYAVCYFEGFVGAIDAIGGVEIDVPDVEGDGRGMNYDDNAGDLHIHLRPGMQRLDGEGALGYVRYRKSNTPGLGDGDSARSGRQQELLQAISEQHLSAADIPGLLAAAKIVASSVETDMSAEEVAGLLRVLHASGSRGMMTRTVPLGSSNRRRGETYYAYADADRLRRTLDEIDAYLDNRPAPAGT